jgi:hypothetical protein
MTNKHIISLWHDELQYLCFGINDEIKNLVHKEIWLDYNNNRIEVTQNALEKILYYLEDPLLKQEIEFQITHQKAK